MKTVLVYQGNAYQRSLPATVVEVVDGKQAAVILDQTIFYPQGGGQPADHGVITGPNGRLDVSHVSYHDGDVLHKGKLSGELAAGDPVELEIDWPRRYRHMQLHSAGHLVDQAVRNVLPEHRALDGNHGIGKHSYVAFDQELSDRDLELVQEAIDRIIADDELITAEMTSRAELAESGVELPADLPGNKELRVVQIGLYPPMPDGGTHLKSSGEAWPVSLNGVKQTKGEWRLLYSVEQPDLRAESERAADDADTEGGDEDKHAEESRGKEKEDKEHMDDAPALAEFLGQVEALNTQFTQDAEGLAPAELKRRYLGKKGAFNQLAKGVRRLSPRQRPAAGRRLNELKDNWQTRLDQLDHQQRQAGPTESELDLTMPGIKPAVGHVHPISQAIAEITGIFERIGFSRARYPEVDWDWYVFEGLNMPPNHPARDEQETFFVDAPAHPTKGKLVMTTHTSNGQVREMERVGQPPVRMVNISRCYRRQQDLTHTQMFHQFEGLVIDRGISIAHLKGTLDYFAREFYGPEVTSRIRPYHFRFTEPSFEVDFSCHVCHGQGRIGAEGKLENCRFCKGGWHEVGGAGMVHPNVLKAGGIDPDEYTGFAFGWGVERTYTLRPGLDIDDIRLLYSADLRFLEQF